MEISMFIGHVIYLWTSQILGSYAIDWKKKIAFMELKNTSK